MADARVAQQHELAKANEWYQNAVKQPGANKAALEVEYNRRVEAIRKKYLSGDARGAEIDSTVERYKNPATGEKLIDNTGSKPADVRADVDLTAKTSESANRLADEWRVRGDAVVESPHKIVNQTTDTTLWKPETPSGTQTKLADPDAYVTPGGQQATAKDPTMARDELGHQLDLERKMIEAQKANDLKGIAKSVDKAAESAGTKSGDPEFYQQAKDIRYYKEPIEAGIVDPGDSPQVAEQKIEAWKQKADAEMQKSAEAAAKKSQVRDQVRENFQESYESANPADPKNRVANENAAQDIKETRIEIETANAEAARNNQRARGENPFPDKPDPFAKPPEPFRGELTVEEFTEIRQTYKEKIDPNAWAPEKQSPPPQPTPEAKPETPPAGAPKEQAPAKHIKDMTPEEIARMMDDIEAKLESPLDRMAREQKAAAAAEKPGSAGSSEGKVPAVDGDAAAATFDDYIPPAIEQPPGSGQGQKPVGADAVPGNEAISEGHPQYEELQRVAKQQVSEARAGGSSTEPAPASGEGVAPAEAAAGAKGGVRKIIGAANEGVGGMTVGGMVGEAGVHQAGEAIDENRELGAGDVGEALVKGSGVKDMYEMGKNISTEEQIAVEKGEQSQLEALGRTGIRMGDQMARGLINDPVDNAIREEEAAAAREGREPNYVQSGYNAGTDIGGSMTGIKPIANAIADIDTWEARGAAASQQDALKEYINGNSKAHVAHLDNLNREINDLAMNGNVKDPAVAAQIDKKVKEMEAEYDYLKKLDEMAGRTVGKDDPAAIDEARRRFQSLPKPETMKEFAQETVTSRGGTPGDVNASGGSMMDNIYKETKKGISGLISEETKDTIKTQVGVAAADSIEAQIKEQDRKDQIKDLENMLKDPNLDDNTRKAIETLIARSSTPGGPTPNEVWENLGKGKTETTQATDEQASGTDSSATGKKPQEDLVDRVGISDETRSAIQQAIDESPDAPAAPEEPTYEPPKPGPRWTPAQLQNDNWNMDTLAGHVSDDIADLIQKSNATHDSSEQKRLQEEIDRKRRELAEIQNRIRENNDLLAKQGVGSDGQTVTGQGGFTPEEIGEINSHGSGTREWELPEKDFSEPEINYSGWNDGPADDANAGEIDVSKADEFLNESRTQASENGGKPAAGDDGGYVIEQGTLGGDIAGDESRTRKAHGERKGDHAGRAESSTGTGDVADPFGELAESINQIDESVQGVSETMEGIDDISDRFKDDDESDPHDHGQGSQSEGVTTLQQPQSPPHVIDIVRTGSGHPPSSGGDGGKKSSTPNLGNGGIISSTGGSGKPPPSITQSSGGGSGGWAVYINHDFLGVGNTANFKPGREEIIMSVGTESAGYAWLCPQLSINYIPMNTQGFESALADYNGRQYRVRPNIMDYCK